MKRTVFFVLAAALLLSGCALTPDYERPELDLPTGWVEGTDSEQVRESIANLKWWEIYRDPTLTSLIEQALEANQDLALAMSRMQEAAYLVTVTRAEQFPFLDVFTGAGRGRQSKQINSFANTENNFSVGANLSFEVDLWRKFARGTEAARAELLSTEAAYRTVTISLVSEVASSYLLLRDLDERLEISKQTADTRRERLRIIRARFEKGTEPELDVNQAEVQLAIAEAAIAQFEREIARTEHALRVLLGRYPGPIPRGASIDLDYDPLTIPVGLPSELLERRPDIVDAEQQLVAETARIGVAQALRFPSLSLTAQVGAVADGLTDLNTADAGQWNVMAGIFQPLFNSGQLKAQKNAQVERAEQANYRYVRALQEAFREVEDSLIEVQTFSREHAARERQTKAAGGAARLSRARYNGGVVDYLEVLDSERTLFNASLDASITKRSALTAVVTLYKALGGGWSVEQEEAARAEAAGEAGEAEEAAVAGDDVSEATPETGEPSPNDEASP